jgi:predicted PurR-regulated permease PerM
VQLPPVLVILSQLVLGAVFGVLGLALATPLLAVAAVPFRRAMGDECDAIGQATTAASHVGY